MFFSSPHISLKGPSENSRFFLWVAPCSNTLSYWRIFVRPSALLLQGDLWCSSFPSQMWLVEPWTSLPCSLQKLPNLTWFRSYSSRIPFMLGRTDAEWLSGLSFLGLVCPGGSNCFQELNSVNFTALSSLSNTPFRFSLPYSYINF